MSDHESRKELLDRIETQAHDLERDVHGCSRCVLKALQDTLDLGDDATLKASTPLAAGVALRGETCGALLGGLLAVGMATASVDLEDADTLRDSLMVGYGLTDSVEKEFGTTNCTKIQTDKLGKFHFLADPEQYEAFIKAGGYVECSKVAGKIARMAAECILDLRDKTKG